MGKTTRAWRPDGLLVAGVAGLFLAWAAPAWADNEKEMRQLAEQPVAWPSGADEQGVALKLLAINDFHSQISAGLSVDGRPVGSAPVLAAYLKEAERTARGPAFIIQAGDHVGASQPQSALLQDEPGIMFFNLLGNDDCRPGGASGPRCNLVGVPGNHELDEGATEMLRLIRGGNHADGPFLQNPYAGASFPYLCANLVRRQDSQPLFAPALTREVDGVRVAFIGALLRQAGNFLPPEHLRDLAVLDEAEAVNHQVRVLKAQGVRAVVVVMHQGGYQYSPSAQPGDEPLAGEIAEVARRLDAEVDVILAGHTHTFHNALVKNAGGRPMLVAQAWPKGTGFADIDLRIDRDSGEVTAMRCRIVTTWADRGPGLRPGAEALALMRRTEAMGDTIAAEEIARAAKPITRTANEAGESALGDLVADAHRHAVNADFAFLTLDALRADLAPGRITRGDQYSVQPHHLNLIRLELTGQQIHDLLNQQWLNEQDSGRRLQVSGLTYTWDARRPPGQRVVQVMRDGQALQPEARYTVAVNEYLAAGGESLTVLTRGVNPVVGPFVADALRMYVQAQRQPLRADIQGRISRIN